MKPRKRQDYDQLKLGKLKLIISFGFSDLPMLFSSASLSYVSVTVAAATLGRGSLVSVFCVKPAMTKKPDERSAGSHKTSPTSRGTAVVASPRALPAEM